MRNIKIAVGKSLSEPFIVGSSYFFDSFDDFEPKDKDIVYIVEEPSLFKKSMRLCGQGDDVYYWKKMTPAEYIEDAKQSKMPMEVGKFLNKELCEHIGFTIDDLAQLKEVFDKLDDKHSYERLIFNSYLKNKDFKLTKYQLNKAYKEYSQTH